MIDNYIKFSKNLSRIAGVIAAFMILTAVLITVEMIWVRFVLNYSTAWQTETVIYMMVGATLIGLSYVQVLRGHVNVDLLPMLIRPKYQKILACLTSVTSIIIVFIMFIYGFDYWLVAYEKKLDIRYCYCGTFKISLFSTAHWLWSFFKSIDS